MARSARPSRAHAVELPAYQPLAHPLTDEARDALDALLERHSQRKLKQHIAAANGAVTETAGDINDRLVHSEALLRRQRARRERDRDRDRDRERNRDRDADDADDALPAEATQEEERFDALKTEIEEVTAEMEAATRMLIDVEVRTTGVQTAFVAVAHGQAIMRRPEDRDRTGPVQMLRQELDKRAKEYERQSLRQRYATHNNYIGFKRTVHDALHPGKEAPPVPHSDSWFPEEGGSRAGGGGGGGGGSRSRSRSSVPATGRARRRSRPAAATGGDHSSDDEIAIAREKTSLKCPITLLAFQDPVSSTKCPHSFEKEAILSMIASSAARLGGTRHGGGTQAVKCPICDQMLTADDLYADHILVRRVKRLAGRDDDDDEDDGDDHDDVDGDSSSDDGGGSGNRDGDEDRSPPRASAELEDDDDEDRRRPARAAVNRGGFAMVED
ncbi:MAG: hypothetical protein M1826_005741 [Phylliscum demangeonii]|nr:MAG: hypothetical protein M1826_005741 [Phylliscum demangeonii]